MRMAAAVKVAAGKKELSAPEGVLSFNKDWRASGNENANWETVVNLAG